jgi:protein tyrosine phosphatase
MSSLFQLPSKSGATIYEKFEKLTFKINDQKEIVRYHFYGWPERGVITSDELDRLLNNMEPFYPNPSDLIWVHCFAGVGRTGVVITAFTLKEKIKKGFVNRENLDTALEEMILEFRKQRGACFVQTREQLGLVRDYALLLLNRRRD